jgi:hypothetical protein
VQDRVGPDDLLVQEKLGKSSSVTAVVVDDHRLVLEATVARCG